MILYTDGGCNKDGAYGSWALCTNDDKCIAFMSREPFPEVNTNNGAEYTAVLHGLEYCEAKGYKNITLHTDSKLVVKQVQGAWRINHEHLRILREEVVELMKNFDTIILQRVKRDVIVEKLGH